MSLQAVILAAGLGRRLGSLTREHPKALLELDGRPLLDFAIRGLLGAGVDDVIVVTGHGHQHVQAFIAAGQLQGSVRTINNPDFATSNNIVSFLTARDVLANGGILMNSDVLIDPRLFVEVVAADEGSWLVLEDGTVLDGEDMKVELDAAGVMRRISKQLRPEAADGEYVGLARLDRQGASVTIDAAASLVAGGGHNLYYEDAFDRAAAPARFRVISTAGRAWTEVDDADDYARAVGIARTLTLAAPA